MTSPAALATVLSAGDHTRLQRIGDRVKHKNTKDREFCRQIGAEWLEFLADKKRGDPRIKIGTELYGLDSDNLTRCVRIAQHWDELQDADAWAAAKEGGYDNGYQYHPEKSSILLRDYRAAMANDQFDSDPSRLLPTANSDPAIDLQCGDALTLLRTIPDKQFNTVITSPPYYRVRDWGAGGMGMEPTIPDFITALVAVLREIRRVLRDDGVCWVVIGDRYASKEREKARHGRHLYHPIPAGPADELPLGNLLLIPQHLVIALQDSGWVIRADIAWDKMRQTGTGVGSRPLAVHDRILMLTKRAKYYYREPKNDRLTIRRPGPFQRMIGRKVKLSPSDRGTSVDVLRIPSDAHNRGHAAPFPQALAQWCAIRSCPPGGRILDPFGGSGTVALVAQEMAVACTSIDINPEYIALSKRRIARARVAPLIISDQAEAAD
jgi:site-specific DNA-methyltransferase (cytosine-N4-specific)